MKYKQYARDYVHTNMYPKEALKISSYKNIITAQITIFTCFLSHIYHIYNFYLILNLNAVCIETGNNPLTNDWDLLACKPQYQILWHRYLGSIQPISLVEFHYTSNLLANIQSTPVSSLHEKPKVHSKFHSQCLSHLIATPKYNEKLS